MHVWSEERVLLSATLGNEKNQPYATSELQTDVPGNTCTTGRFPNMTVSLMAFRQVLYQKLAEMIRVIYTRPKKGHCRDTSEQRAVEVAEQGRCHVLSHRVTACTNPHRPSDAQFDLRLPNRIALKLRTSADFQVYTPQCKLCLIRSSMKMFNIEKVRLS